MSKRGILVTLSRESINTDYPYSICDQIALLDSLNKLKEKGFSTYFIPPFNQKDPTSDKWVHWADDEGYSGDFSEIEDIIPLYINDVDKDEVEQFMLKNNITHTFEYIDDTFDLSQFIIVTQ